MSNRALTWAFDTDVKPAGAKFVLVALADFADEENSCFPSQSRLAAMTGQARESVLRHLKTLESAAFIHRSRRSNDDGYRITDRFVLNVGGDVPMLENAYVTNCLVGKNTGPMLQKRSKKPRNRHSNPHEPLLNPQVLSSEVAPQRPDVDKLLEYLDSRIQGNGAKVPSRTKKNQDSARLLLDVDGYSVEQVASLITYATGDEFWRSNILSMSKLRAKADTLKLQLQRGARTTDRGADILRSEMEKAKARDAERGPVSDEAVFSAHGF